MVNPLLLAVSGVTKPEDLARASRHNVKHTYKTMIQPIRLMHSSSFAGHISFADHPRREHSTSSLMKYVMIRHGNSSK
jgi:hypothetical protein